MKKLVAVAAIAGLMGSTAAFADAGADLAKGKNCLACHAVDKVQKGGVGAWGQIPMPPNPQVSPAEAKTLVAWVLSQK